MTEMKAVFQAPDGTLHDTKALAIDHMRAPLIKAELMKLTGNKEDLATWLVDNRELVADAFGAGTIKRVTKSEKKKLHNALEAIVAADNKDFAFIADNAAAIEETFRWPTVKRMDDDEKSAAAQEAINAEADNPELAAWAVENKDAILEAFDAGKVKREVSPKAMEALAAYREKTRLEKEAKEEAEGSAE